MNTKKLFHFCLFLLVNVYSKNVNDKHYKKNNQNNKKKNLFFHLEKTHIIYLNWLHGKVFQNLKKNIIN